MAQNSLKRVYGFLFSSTDLWIPPIIRALPALVQREGTGETTPQNPKADSELLMLLLRS